MNENAMQHYLRTGDVMASINYGVIEFSSNARSPLFMSLFLLLVVIIVVVVVVDIDDLLQCHSFSYLGRTFMAVRVKAFMVRVLVDGEEEEEKNKMLGV